jgi:group II intron reverse transcriptase/maturase
LPPNLLRVKEAAQRDRRTRFTALLHHVDIAALRRSFYRLKRNASAGVDGETVASYEPELDEKLRALHARVHKGSYRPLPIRRVYIPKADDGRRPIGIPALEDKIVQGAVAEVLNVIYEVDFLDCSYGFRSGRSPHDALNAVFDGVMRQHVNYVLDADIRSFFDSVDHEKMMRALQERIADRRVLRLIGQWLKAGILESGECRIPEEGTPQGALISPLLANVYLHYALDKWVARWQADPRRGPMIFVRYADDFIIGFKHEHDAQKMLADLKARMAQCGLALNEGKTRLIEFGRFAAERRARRGERRPETFDFLGFTHYCSETRKGRFLLKRKTIGKRLRGKVKQLRKEMMERMHTAVSEQHKWLCSVLRGHYAYFGVRCNVHCLHAFWRQVQRLWHHALRRRDGKRSLTWERFEQLLELFPLPEPTITHTRRLAMSGLR